ncbi:MAG: hypothetical protein SPL83_07840 [Succinivibrio sp.]|nr:hypothetical protein [Succinivibrio sp.]
MTYSQTDDGLVECCGQKDCDEKACGSYTSVKLPDGSTQVCCGKNDCEEKFASTLPDKCVTMGDDVQGGFPRETNYQQKLSDFFSHSKYLKSIYIEKFGCGNAICHYTVDGTKYDTFSPSHIPTYIEGPIYLDPKTDHIFGFNNHLDQFEVGLTAGWVKVCGSYQH